MEEIQERVSEIDIALDMGNQTLLQILGNRNYFQYFPSSPDVRKPSINSSSFSLRIDKDCIQNSPFTSERNIANKHPNGIKFLKNENFSFSMCEIYEDYIDWNESTRLMHLKESAERLKNDQKQSESAIISKINLIRSKTEELSKFLDVLREKEHALSTDILDCVVKEKKYRQVLSKISETTQALKERQGKLQADIFWNAMVVVKNITGVYRNSFETALLSISGSNFLLDLEKEKVNSNSPFYQQPNHSSLNSKILSTEAPEPFISYTTGPVRRIINQHIMKHKHKQFEMNLKTLQKVVIVKSGNDEEFKRDIVFHFLPTESGHSEHPDSTDSPLSSSYKSNSSLVPPESEIVHIQLIDPVNKSKSDRLQTGDYLVYVIRSLVPDVTILCEIKGKIYPYDRFTSKYRSESRTESMSFADCTYDLQADLSELAALESQLVEAVKFDASANFNSGLTSSESYSSLLPLSQIDQSSTPSFTSSSYTETTLSNLEMNSFSRKSFSSLYDTQRSVYSPKTPSTPFSPQSSQSSNVDTFVNVSSDLQSLRSWRQETTDKLIASIDQREKNIENIHYLQYLRSLIIDISLHRIIYTAFDPKNPLDIINHIFQKIQIMLNNSNSIPEREFESFVHQIIAKHNLDLSMQSALKKFEHFLCSIDTEIDTIDPNLLETLDSSIHDKASFEHYLEKYRTYWKKILELHVRPISHQFTTLSNQILEIMQCIWESDIEFFENFMKLIQSTLGKLQTKDRIMSIKSMKTKSQHITFESNLDSDLVDIEI